MSSVDRSLDSLSPRFRPLVDRFLARTVEAKIPVMIINTRRTPEEQQHALATGVSWTMHSKHLTGDAIDICPYSQFDLHGPDKLQWDVSDPAWMTLGALGEAVGMEWGGRWTQRDMGHFQFREHPSTIAA